MQALRSLRFAMAEQGESLEGKMSPKKTTPGNPGAVIGFAAFTD